jgi:two-component system chemotaxis response regulator CheB
VKQNFERQHSPRSPRASEEIRRDLIVIGASAGGVTALEKLVGTLPSQFAAAVLIVLHLSTAYESRLAKILGRKTLLPVHTGKDGDVIKPGSVYVAPSGRHLMLAGNEIKLEDGPRVNWHKPSVDVLFLSAAEEYGPRVIGVVLTGGQNCGTAGLIAIKRHGGISIVQDPDDAEHPQMPRSAIREADVDYCLPLEKIGPLLSRLGSSMSKKS